jgi:hypothetical protein
MNTPAMIGTFRLTEAIRPDRLARQLRLSPAALGGIDEIDG